MGLKCTQLLFCHAQSLTDEHCNAPYPTLCKTRKDSWLRQEHTLERTLHRSRLLLIRCLILLLSYVQRLLPSDPPLLIDPPQLRLLISLHLPLRLKASAEPASDTCTNPVSCLSTSLSPLALMVLTLHTIRTKHMRPFRPPTTAALIQCRHVSQMFAGC